MERRPHGIGALPDSSPFTGGRAAGRSASGQTGWCADVRRCPESRLIPTRQVPADGVNGFESGWGVEAVEADHSCRSMFLLVCLGLLDLGGSRFLLFWRGNRQHEQVLGGLVG